jgi:hypothetical protein
MTVIRLLATAPPQLEQREWDEQIQQEGIQPFWHAAIFA